MKAGPFRVALLALAPPTTASAQPIVVPPAEQVPSIGAASAMDRPAPEQRPLLRTLPRSRQALSRAKSAAERRRPDTRPCAREASAGARVAVASGLSAPGLGAFDALLGVPPDTTGSIGPGHYVEHVNDAVAVFRRSDLARVAGPLFNELFMRSPPGTFVSDPQMQWDQEGGRWLYLAVAFTIDLRKLRPVGPNYLQYGSRSQATRPTS